MLDLYASVGVTSFEVTWTDANADKQRFRRGVPLADLARALPRILDDAARRKHSARTAPSGHSFSLTTRRRADRPRGKGCSLTFLYQVWL